MLPIRPTVAQAPSGGPNPPNVPADLPWSVLPSAQSILPSTGRPSTGRPSTGRPSIDHQSAGRLSTECRSPG